jgi:hypothetical protein
MPKGVNSRVSDVSDWIDAIVCEMSENPPAEFCPPLVVAHVPSLLSGEWPTATAVALGLFALLTACTIRTILYRGTGKLSTSSSPAEQENLRRDSIDSYYSVE